MILMKSILSIKVKVKNHDISMCLYKEGITSNNSFIQVKVKFML